MAVKVTETRLTSDITAHFARFEPDAAADGQGAWSVSWCGSRQFDRDRAIRSLLLAEHVECGNDAWLISTLAAELGLSDDDMARLLPRAPSESIPMAETLRISSVLIETNPFVESFGEDGPSLAPDYADMDAQWRQALNELLAHPDATHCWRCDEPVGFALHGNEQRPRWVSTALAREGDGLVAVLCEECAPYVPEMAQTGVSSKGTKASDGKTGKGK